MQETENDYGRHAREYSVPQSKSNASGTKSVAKSLNIQVVVAPCSTTAGSKYLQVCHPVACRQPFLALLV